MTSQDIKKQLKEPHFWNIVLTGQHAEPRTKAMLEAKGIITVSYTHLTLPTKRIV